MKFLNYINEEKNIDVFVNTLKKDCGPYLKDGKNIGKENFFYSGRSDVRDFFMKKVRKNRIPKNTPKEIHDFIDNGFYKKFGVRARSNSIFAYINKSKTYIYGNPYILFPIGKYKTISSSKIEDLYIMIEELLIDMSEIYVDIDNINKIINNMSDQDLQDFLKEIEKRLNNSDYKINNLNKHNEHMIICDSVYLFKEKFETDIREKLK